MKKLIFLIILLFALPVGAGHYEEGQSRVDIGKPNDYIGESSFVFDGFDVYEYDRKEFKTFGEVIEYIVNKTEPIYKPNPEWKTVKTMQGKVRSNILYGKKPESQIYFYNKVKDKGYYFWLDGEYPLDSEVIMEIKIKVKE